MFTIALGIGSNAAVYSFARGLASSRVATLLAFAAGMVLFIACASVASFLLARASSRSHEISIRVALGASRTQLARELLADSIAISVAGAATGMLLALSTSRIIPALLFAQDAERLAFAADVSGIVAACAACAAITIVCGLLPVFAIPHHRPSNVLRRESSGPSKTIRRLRATLVVAQMATCCMLAVSTAYLLYALRGALRTSAGHRLGRPILATVRAGPDAGSRYFERVEHAVQTLPGVTTTAWAWRLPGALPAWRFFRVEPRNLPLRETTMDIAWFTPDSMALITLPPRAGRMFGFGDESRRVAIVNLEAAEELFSGETVGRSIQDPARLPVEIIGVVSMRAIDSRPTIYYYGDQNRAPPDRIPEARFRAPVASHLPAAELDVNIVSPQYFEVMGLSPPAGRDFNDRSEAGAYRLAIINRQAADLCFGGIDKAVGSAVIDVSGRRTQIVGVVGSPPIGTFQRRVEPTIFFPMAQENPPGMTLIAGARNTGGPTLSLLRHRIESVSGAGPSPLVVRTLETYLGQTALAPLRIATTIFGALASIAAILGVLGLAGALSDAARQRRREMAVRIALGARRRHVFARVLLEGGRLACAGALAGVLGSLILSRYLSRIGPGAEAPALWVWLAGPLVLMAAVAVASALPARRASMVNPVTIMRGDS